MWATKYGITILIDLYTVQYCAGYWVGREGYKWSGEEG
jgi:hypothetical protein